MSNAGRRFRNLVPNMKILIAGIYFHCHFKISLLIIKRRSFQETNLDLSKHATNMDKRFQYL